MARHTMIDPLERSKRLMKSLSEKVDQTDAYNRGFDCGMFGATEHNCHFSIFSSPENTKEWERGKTDAEKQKGANP